MSRCVLKSMVLTSFAVLTALPASAQSGQVYAELGPIHIRIASNAPPPVRYERRSAQPYADAVWLNGYWDRRDDNWAWSSGRWERPRDRHARWIKAGYRQEGRSWRYTPAHWSYQQVVEGSDYQQWKHDQRSKGNHPHN